MMGNYPHCATDIAECQRCDDHCARKDGKDGRNGYKVSTHTAPQAQAGQVQQGGRLVHSQSSEGDDLKILNIFNGFKFIIRIKVHL